MYKKDVMKMDDVAKQLNNLTYTDYYYRLMLIARSVFKWNNLPNNIDEKWIEKFLYCHGSCIFFKDSEKGFMVAKSTPAGTLNYYDEPTLLKPYGTGYSGEPLENNSECVVIRNNDIMMPTAPSIELYALRLADISRTIDVNVNAQKTPVIILCSDKQKLSLKQAYKQIDGNKPVIFGDKNLDIEGIKALKTDAPIVFDKLQIQKHSIWNECMTMLGINNANMDKRERLVDDEVQANNEQINISCEVMLKARQQACKMINELFDLNISVEKRNDLQAVLEGSEDVPNHSEVGGDKNVC